VFLVAADALQGAASLPKNPAGYPVPQRTGKIAVYGPGGRIAGGSRPAGLFDLCELLDSGFARKNGRM
jgi:hypothetical protein